MKTTILDLPEEELLNPGNRACAGCALGIAYRVGLKALGRDTLLVVPPSCLTVLQGLFPIAATKLASLNVTFASTASAATGLLAALKVTGRTGVNVAAWAGDGGTSDIGLQALSGACERGDNFLFICYDNEGYMNTGVQRSGTTPQWAITANTPIKGKLQPNKNVPAIMSAHGIDYVASTSAAYPLDLYDKVKKALTYQGVKYIHIHTPCPPGWGFDPRYAVKVGKLAVETGLYELYEIEKSQLRHTGASLKLMEKRRLLPVKDYLRAQGRFKTMADAEMEKIQDLVARKWEGYFESFDEIEGGE